MSSAILEGWVSALGAERVITDRAAIAHYLRDIGEFKAPMVHAIVHVSTTEDVTAVVKVNDSTSGAAPIPLYPVSTGRNWGLGSKVPVADGCAVVDMHLMARIRSLDTRLGVAVVEPGVTLAMLHDALEAAYRDPDGAAATPSSASSSPGASGSSGHKRRPAFFGNTTASCAHTSVLGNCMDRGVGFARQRADDLLGLEVVMSTGAVARFGGFWHATDTPTFHYKHGLGPDLVPLFTQSNFGIATAAAVSLLPMPEVTQLVVIDFARGSLRPAMDVLAGFYRDKLMTSVCKIYNESALANYGVDTSADFKSAPDGGGAFRLIGSVFGPTDVVRAARREIEARVTGSGAFTSIAFHTEEDLEAPGTDPGLQEAFGRFTGVPTCEGHKRGFGPTCDLDHAMADDGWIFFVPIVPLTGADAEKAVDILSKCAADSGIHERLGATLNIIGNTCVDLVTTIHFERTPEGTAKAHRALDLLHERCRAAGYFSYREDVRHMDLFGSDAYRGLLVSLKRALDPKSMFAPGRYVPDIRVGGDGDGVTDVAELPVTYEQWEEEARKVLPPLMYSYYRYTIGHGRSVDAVRSSLSSLRLVKRCLTGVGNEGSVDTRVTLFGAQLAAPIIIAPTAMHRMVHAEAEFGTARGAARAGVGYAINALLSTAKLDDICATYAATTAAAATGGDDSDAAGTASGSGSGSGRDSAAPAAAAAPGAGDGGTWMHVYIFQEREVTERVVRRAVALGFKAIVVTADHPTTRITDIFQPRFEGAAMRGELMPDFGLPNIDPEWAPGMPLTATNDGSLTWTDIDWLRGLTPLPIIVKGVSCVADAALAIRHGAAGIVVSNHGGRQVDGDTPAIEVLPDIVAAFGGKLKIFVDSGIRTGGDALRALALGADGVLVGRAPLWGLAVAGAVGVERVMSTLVAELRSDMAHCGLRRIADVSPDILTAAPYTAMAAKL